MDTPITSRRGQGELFAAAALAIGVFVLHWPSATVEFVRLDDWQYVVDNPLVRSPSWQGVARVLSEVRHPSTVDGYYQPLTMASLMLDGVLSGPDAPSPFVFRLTSVFLHALASIAVMLVLREAIGGIWIPAMIAALFAAHPVQVESVAWISQRKTVLSGWLALSATWGYLRYRRTDHAGWMAAATGLFALAVLSKPTAVLIPLTWLLLDKWPLRIRPNWRALTPVLAIMVVSGIVAWTSQAASGAGLVVAGGKRLVFDAAQALVAVGQYVTNLVWPMVLSPYRPLLGGGSVLNPASIASGIGVVLATSLAWALRRRAPFLAVALISFLVLLAPAVGLVRFDETVIADRFLYLPLAFALMAVGGLAHAARFAASRREYAAPVLLAVLLIPLAALNRAQQGIWQDSLALWTHVAEICPDLKKAQYELAAVKLELGLYDEALVHAREAVESRDGNSQYFYIHGRALSFTGDQDGAIEQLNTALERGLGPQEPWARATLARAFILRGNSGAARDQIALAQAKGDVGASEYAALADSAWRKADAADFAVELYDMAIARGGPVVVWRWNRGGALEQAGRLPEALAAYDDVLAELKRAGLIAPPEFERARAALAARLVRASAASRPTSEPATP